MRRSVVESIEARSGKEDPFRIQGCCQSRGTGEGHRFRQAAGWKWRPVWSHPYPPALEEGWGSIGTGVTLGVPTPDVVCLYSLILFLVISVLLSFFIDALWLFF